MPSASPSPHAGARLQVHITFDIEVWCGGWDDLDARFPAAFERYFYGRSEAGAYALPRTLEILNAHGLQGFSSSSRCSRPASASAGCRRWWT